MLSSKNYKTLKFLSMDGGGIKGLIQLQILCRIERDTGINIRDHFDAFSGTSAGSIIACSIVYGNHTAEYIRKNILQDKKAKQIMRQSIWDRVFNVFQFRPKYSGEPKRELIEDTMNGKIMGLTEKYVVVSAYDISNKKTVFFKSWNPEHMDIPVSKVVDASSAAPSFYPSIKIGKDYYIDGAVSANNPTDSSYSDLLELHPEINMKILSLGTGYTQFDNNPKKNFSNWGGLQWLLDGDLFNLVFETPDEMVDYRMRRFASSMGHEYLRIDGALENTSIDDTSDENLNKLREVGDLWYEQNKDRILKFFRE